MHVCEPGFKSNFSLRYSTVYGNQPEFCVHYLDRKSSFIPRRKLMHYTHTYIQAYKNGFYAYFKNIYTEHKSHSYHASKLIHL